MCLNWAECYAKQNQISCWDWLELIYYGCKIKVEFDFAEKSRQVRWEGVSVQKLSARAQRVLFGHKVADYAHTRQLCEAEIFCPILEICVCIYYVYMKLVQLDCWNLGLCKTQTYSPDCRLCIHISGSSILNSLLNVWVS